MDKTQARKAVLVATVFMFGLAIKRGSATHDTVGDFKRIYSVGVVFLFLSLLADFAPQIAGPFAVVVVLGSLTAKGDAAILGATSGIGGKAKAAAATVATN